MIRARAIILVPIIVSLLYLAFTCFRWALADVYATQVNYIVEKEDDSVSDENVLAWQRAGIQLKEALLLRSQYPQYLELAENFYQTLYDLETDAPDLIEALSWKNNENTALKYAEEALLYRPSWPYLWKELLISKEALNQFDDEQKMAVERSIVLGPWQQSIHYQIALLGLDNWDIQTDKIKLLTLKAINQSMIMNQVNSYRKNLKLLLDHNNLIKACELLRGDRSISFPALLSYCQ